MRRRLFLLVLLLLLASETALACKPRFWSPNEVARTASAIFIAEVVAKRYSDAGKELVELRVTEVLKGNMPTAIVTETHNIAAMGDACNAIQGIFPTLSIGEKWIISGKFGATGNAFVSIGETSLRLSSESKHAQSYLNQLRLEIGGLRGQ